MSGNRKARRLACSMAIGLGASGALAQPTITDLGVLGGTDTYSLGYAVSADGLVVAGVSSSASGQRAFRWTSAGGMETLGALTGFATLSTAGALSADGSVAAGTSVGSGNVSRLFRWTSASGIQNLGVLGTGSSSFARGISADGSVVVGGSYVAGFNGAVAARWTSATGLQSLGGIGSVAAAITPGGSVIVGTDVVDGYLIAFRWTSGGGMQHLGVLDGADSAEAFAVSADGTMAAGYSGDQFNGTYNRAVRWTGLGGGAVAVQDLGALTGSQYSYARAMSADGAVAVGSSTLGAEDHAVIWTSSLGMVDLNTHLPAHGIDLSGWVLAGAYALSADGTAIAGYGTHNGQTRAFLVRGLPRPCACPPDFNCSGGLEVQDIFDFINSWLAVNPTADFNHADGITVADIFDFLNSWLAGC